MISMKNKIMLIFLFFLFVHTSHSYAQNYQVSGAGSAFTNGLYIPEGTFYSRTYYKHQTSNYYIYCDNFGGVDYWNIDNNLDDNDDVYYYSESSDPTPPSGGWTVFSGTNPPPTVTSSADVTFTNGSSFTPIVTQGSSNQAIGRFQLTGAVSGASLTDASIKLNGTRTGMSNIKLWSSVDNSFNAGSDTQLSSTVSSDPGDGNSATFSSFSSSISTSGTYYFVTVDIASDATGVVQGVIVQNSSLTISSGTLSGSISNAPLSSGDVSLPVELTSFSARAEGHSIILSWSTESEVDNLGFILERNVNNLAVWQIVASYLTDDALKGLGSTSSRTNYEFKDTDIQRDQTYSYKLSQVHTDGTVIVLDIIQITLDCLPTETVLQPAFPNPFNPNTKIFYELAEDLIVNLTVTDIMGRTIARLLSEKKQPAGSYNLYWNGKNDSGYKAASGTYIILLHAGDVIITQKVILMR